MSTERRNTPIRYVGDVVISTAQNLEDVLLYRVFGGKRDGFYVDIGAGDPNWDSVTNWFYRVGWTGINIEANPIFAPSYKRFRPRDINLNVGIAAQEGSMTFYQVKQNAQGQGWGLSSFDPAALETAKGMGFEVNKIAVPTMPLREIMRKHTARRDFDFLKVDVEGLERTVLESADWNAFRPAVICIESIAPLTANPVFDAWEPMLLDKDYLFAMFDGVNGYYVHKESADLLPQFNAGVNCNDHYRKATGEDLSDVRQWA